MARRSPDDDQRFDPADGLDKIPSGRGGDSNEWLDDIKATGFDSVGYGPVKGGGLESVVDHKADDFDIDVKDGGLASVVDHKADDFDIVVGKHDALEGQEFGKGASSAGGVAEVESASGFTKLGDIEASDAGVESGLVPEGDLPTELKPFDEPDVLVDQLPEPDSFVDGLHKEEVVDEVEPADDIDVIDG